MICDKCGYDNFDSNNECTNCSRAIEKYNGNKSLVDDRVYNQQIKSYNNDNKIAIAVIVIIIIAITIIGNLPGNKDNMASNKVNVKVAKNKINNIPTNSESQYSKPPQPQPQTNYEQNNVITSSEPQYSKPPQSQNNDEYTDDNTLHLAAKEGKIETIKTLLDKKVNINALERIYHCSPLHYAAENGKIEAIKLLLSNNANANSISKTYGSPLHLASQGGHDEAVKLLIEKGADINIIDNKGETSIFIYLGPAYMFLRMDMIKYFVENGANLNMKNNNGNTPLHIAATYKNNSELISLLISKGAQTDIQNNEGNTPLHCAVIESKTDSVKALLVNQIILNIKNNLNQTPLDIALKSRNEMLVKLLKDYGAK